MKTNNVDIPAVFHLLCDLNRIFHSFYVHVDRILILFRYYISNVCKNESWMRLPHKTKFSTNVLNMLMKITCYITGKYTNGKCNRSAQKFQPFGCPTCN